MFNSKAEKTLYKSYFDCVFRQIKLSSKFTSFRPRDVILFEELLLQSTDLLAGEGRSVTPDVVHGLEAAHASATLHSHAALAAHGCRG